MGRRCKGHPTQTEPGPGELRQPSRGRGDTQHAHARVWGPAGALTSGEGWIRPRGRAEPFPGEMRGGERGPQPRRSLLQVTPLAPGLCLHPRCSAANTCQKKGNSCPALPAHGSKPKSAVKRKKTNKQDASAQGASAGGHCAEVEETLGKRRSSLLVEDQWPWATAGHTPCSVGLYFIFPRAT